MNYMSPAVLLLAVEAANSVAMEHADDCNCVACRAAHGEPLALALVFAMMEVYRERDER